MEVGKNAAIAAVQTVAQKASRGSTLKQGASQGQSGGQQKKGGARRGAASRSRSR
jgi:hypothetical protein